MFLTSVILSSLLVFGAKSDLPPSVTDYNIKVPISTENHLDNFIIVMNQNLIRQLVIDTELTGELRYNTNNGDWLVYLQDFNVDINVYETSLNDYSSTQLSSTQRQTFDFTDYGVVTFSSAEALDLTINVSRSGSSSLYFDFIYRNDYLDSLVYTGNLFVGSPTSEYSYSFSNYMASQIQNYINNEFELNNQYITGYNIGYNEGYQTGSTDSYASGYNDGFNEAVGVNNTAITIFNGILNIALVPVNFFLAIFNFEILGINMSAFVSALLSICMIIILIRIVTGKKADGK